MNSRDDKEVVISMRELNYLVRILSSKGGGIGLIIIVTFVVYQLLSMTSLYIRVAGIFGSPLIFYLVTIFGVLIGLIAYLILRSWVLSKKLSQSMDIIENVKLARELVHNIPIVYHNDEVLMKRLVTETARLTILSSRSSTSYTLFNRILRQIERNRPLEITILFRGEGTQERNIILRNAVELWNSLIEELPFKLSIRFLVTHNWTVMFRGMIFDDTKALMGFYIRDDEVTRGSEEDYLFVTSEGGGAEKYLFLAMLNASKAVLKSATEF